jgi:hypothetical protein
VFVVIISAERAAACAILFLFHVRYLVVLPFVRRFLPFVRRSLVVLPF